MNLVRWQPKAIIRSPLRVDDFETEMDRLFDWAFGGDRLSARPMVPAVDVAEEDGKYVVKVDLPGLTQDDVEITYQDGVLTIKGEKKATSKQENRRIHVRERFEGKFGRNVNLPERIDVDKIEATMKEGVLDLVLPFVPEAQPRKIRVNG